MPISATGEQTAGFTLLEVLGIIVLLGLACTLVYPNMTSGAEKTRLQYIGKLLISDIRLVQETAVVERANAEIVFAGDGYYYDLGDNRVTRSFPEYGFAFKNIIESSTGETLVSSDNEGELTFETDGSCREMTLDWQSDHYRGSLQVAADGTVSWKYEAKGKKQ